MAGRAHGTCSPRKRSWRRPAPPWSRSAARCPGRRSRRPMHSTRRPAGRRLADLFEGRGRLIVYHFMFAPDWQQGCPDCSRLADHFDGMLDASGPSRRDLRRHLARPARPRSRTIARARDGASSGCRPQPCDFNYDYQVSFPAEAIAGGEVVYGYERCKIDKTELPGTSVFGAQRGGRGLPRLLGLFQRRRHAAQPSTTPTCWHIAAQDASAALLGLDRSPILVGEAFQRLLERPGHVVVLRRGLHGDVRPRQHLLHS